jgi:uncharacterized protein YggE
MHDSPILAVRGEVALEVQPEVARIEVSVAAREADRAQTLRMLAKRDARVTRVFDSLSEIMEKYESSGSRVGPLPFAGTTAEPGYHGVIHHTVTVVGFDRLGELIAQLADQDLIEVGGPWWDLRPDSDAYRQARIAAVWDAVRRARDYAEAVGSQLAGLVELADAHLLSESRAPAEARALAAPSPRLPHRPRAVAVEEPVFDLTPVRQVIRAVVEARFTITSPDLGRVPA